MPGRNCVKDNEKGPKIDDPKQARAVDLRYSIKVHNDCERIPTSKKKKDQLLKDISDYNIEVFEKPKTEKKPQKPREKAKKPQATVASKTVVVHNQRIKPSKVTPATSVPPTKVQSKTVSKIVKKPPEKSRFERDLEDVQKQDPKFMQGVSTIKQARKKYEKK